MEADTELECLMNQRILGVTAIEIWSIYLFFDGSLKIVYCNRHKICVKPQDIIIWVTLSSWQTRLPSFALDTKVYDIFISLIEGL